VNAPRQERRDSLTNLIEQVDALQDGQIPPDTVPSGFPSLDRALGGGFRRRDLIVLGGDIGSGKSALAIGIAVRTAKAGYPVVYFSGEMDADRWLERAVAIEGRAQIDEIRTGKVSEPMRASLGAAAVRLRDLPIAVRPLGGQDYAEALEPAWEDQPALLVVDYLQLLPPPVPRLTLEEDCAASIRALKATALQRSVALLAVTQLPGLGRNRPDPRPTLDDFGALGSVKQHADLALGLYREEMYNKDAGVEGATELLVIKNRNGPTGFIDLYFYQRWMRFEDMLDPSE